MVRDQGNERDGPVTRSRTKEVEDISFARNTQGSKCEETNRDILGHILLANIHKDHATYEEAMNSDDKELWKQAIDDE